MTERSRWARVHGGHEESDDWATEQTQTHTHTDTHTQTHRHTQTHTHIHSHTHRYTHRHTQTHTDTHTDTQQNQSLLPRAVSTTSPNQTLERQSHCADKPPKATQRETLPSLAQRRDGFFTALNNVDTNKSGRPGHFKMRKDSSSFFLFLLKQWPL